MILSNAEIHKAIERGLIIIDPKPALNIGDAGNPYDTTALNLRLGNSISIPREGMPFAFDLRKGGIAKFLTSMYDNREIGEGGYSLKPGKFVLSNTKERVGLPIIESSPCYAARVEGRSSFARCGLLVHFTAPTIHAGFEGTITLEIINLGNNDILLYPDMEICQLIFELVHGEIFINPSQFQGQSTPEGKA